MAAVTFWASLEVFIAPNIREHISAEDRAVVVAVVALTLLAADLVRAVRGRPNSLGPSRQTPYRWGRNYRFGTALWGLDTGIPVTTVRASALPLFSVAGASFGFGGLLTGALYVVSFCGAVLFMSFRSSMDTSRNAKAGHVSSLIRLSGLARLVGISFLAGFLVLVILSTERSRLLT
jgi:hypothetical protein